MKLCAWYNRQTYVTRLNIPLLDGTSVIHSVPATIIIMMKSKRFARIDLLRIVSISVIFTDELAEIFTLGSDIRLCKVIIMFPRFSL